MSLTFVGLRSKSSGEAPVVKNVRGDSRGVSRLALNTALACCLSVVVAGQPAAVEWDVDVRDWQRVGEANLTADERESVLRLARQLGIERPRRVSLQVRVPGVCLFVLVESDVVEAGPHLSWRELPLYRRDWSECSGNDRKKNTRRQAGRWIAYGSSLEKREAWRVRDGEWRVDVGFYGVPYAETERIVLAIRQRVLVSRLPSAIGPLILDTTIPDIDAGTVTYIARSATESGRYPVHTARGVLNVAIAEDRVELHDLYVPSVSATKPPDPAGLEWQPHMRVSG